MVALAVLELADGGQRQEVDEGVATHTPAFSIQTKSTCCPRGITAPSRRLSGSEVGCLDRFRCMAFAQLTFRKRLWAK